MLLRMTAKQLIALLLCLFLLTALVPAALAEDGYSHVCDIGGFIDWQGEVETAAS